MAARTVKDALVVDFSALWAGPLCAHLLGLAGARVVKVETPTRPDGARRGDRAFYDLLHAGHRSVVLDPATPAGRRALAGLVRAADIVIEASRPRALAGFGLDAEAAVAGGTRWVSITADGRASGRIGFGDDVAAGGGLVCRDADLSPLFCGDAIADPLTGLTAAVLAATGPPDGGVLWDAPMADVVAATLTPGPPSSQHSGLPLPRRLGSRIGFGRRSRGHARGPETGRLRSGLGRRHRGRPAGPGTRGPMTPDAAEPGILFRDAEVAGFGQSRCQRVSVGPYKIVLADSDLPSLTALNERIRAAHGDGRAVAVHCVTRESLLLLLAAFAEAGVRDGDRIEHAAIVPPDVIGELSRLGLRVVTQPGFIADRGDDHLRDVPADDRGDLYRCRLLSDAGVPVALSSDAPYGPIDPWLVMDAAVRRRTRSGAAVVPDESVPASAALGSYLSPPDDPGGPPRRVRPGAGADLVLLRTTLDEALRSLGAGLVRCTVIAGRIIEP